MEPLEAVAENKEFHEGSLKQIKNLFEKKIILKYEKFGESIKGKRILDAFSGYGRLYEVYN